MKTTDQTTLPPGPEDRQAAREAVAKLVADAPSVLDDGRGHLHVTVKGTDDLIDLPPVMRDILQNVLEHFAAGRGVRILPVDIDLTTSQAAGILGVSRPYLIKLLDAGDIPHVKVNRHRRVKIEDLMRYREEQQEARGRSLDEMQRLSDDLGLYD